MDILQMIYILHLKIHFFIMRKELLQTTKVTIMLVTMKSLSNTSITFLKVILLNIIPILLLSMMRRNPKMSMPTQEIKKRSFYRMSHPKRLSLTHLSNTIFWIN